MKTLEGVEEQKTVTHILKIALMIQPDDDTHVLCDNLHCVAQLWVFQVPINAQIPVPIQAIHHMLLPGL